MRKFDYTFLMHDSIPSDTVGLLTTVNQLTIERKALVDTYPKLFEELMKLSMIQSVISSNAIEGIVTTDERMKGLLNGSISPMNHNEKEILGYKDVLQIVHNNHQYSSFSEKQILAFHRLLLSYERPSYAGNYKTEDNVIMETDAFGKRSVRFKPTPAKDTKQAMEQLVLAYTEARDDSRINQLVLIPCVILDFLSIHPFSDGNGRMSRLLSLLLLYKNNYVIGKYISFENQINLNKREYYESLKLSSTQWNEGLNNYYPYINQFLMTLIRCYNELDKRFNIVFTKRMSKKERIKESIVQSLVPVSRKDILLLWPDIAIDTVKKALIELQKEGIIRKIGQYKDAKYVGLNE